MYKKLLSMSLAAVLIFSLVSTIGCAPSKKAEKSSSVPTSAGTTEDKVETKEVKSEKKVTIDMWVMPNSLEPIADVERILAGFEKENPNIKIKITSVDWGAAWSKITTAATSGDVPDIVQIGSTWVSAIAGMGALEDITDRVPELGGSEVFMPVAWKTTEIEGTGKTVAIPWIVDARALYYRVDAFKKAGVSPAGLGTWASFKDSLEKIYDADVVIDGESVAPLGISGKNDWNVIHSLAPWIWAAGGDFLSPDRKTCTLDSPEVLKAIMYYIGLVTDNYVPIEYLELNTAQVSGNFNQGTCSMYFDGPYEVRTLTRPASEGGAYGSITSRNFAVTQYPKGPKGSIPFVGGSTLAIFKQAKHKDEAFKVIKYLTRRKQQIDYAKVSGFLPARRDAFSDPYFSIDPHRSIFKQAVLNGRTYPPIPCWGLIEPILTRRFGIMWDYVINTNEVKEAEIKKQLKMAKIEVEAILAQSE